MLKVASCDSQGAVYIARDAVFRLVGRSHEDSVLSVLKLTNSAGIEGIVQTEVCASREVADIIDDAIDALVLKHKKIAYISYPHEWCAAMLKDAALFHLDLSARLYGQGLFLKDAHPWNILFEKGQPIFVDFTSIVSRDSLFAEEYLESNKLHRGEGAEARLALILKEIFERMYLPYFVSPLSAYAFGQRSRVRKAIENTTLNSSTSIITMKDCLPGLQPRMSALTKLFGLLKLRFGLKKVIKQLLEKKNVSGFYQGMHQCVTNLRVGVGSSGYSAYYKLKGEDHGWAYSEEWNAKQKVVYNALNTPEISTVLDVACNTGWFAVMAEKLSKRVVAFDIDEACIESLYTQVKHDQLDILPLVMNFTELTQDRYSICDGKKVLINASQRLRSDSVIALGIIHHLTLGLGLTFEEVLDQLIPLCEKQLVIEFVDASDAMIQNEPSFFSAYYQNKELLAGYELGKLISLCEARGFEVRCERSHPSTRTIVVCRKLTTA
jgi:SAM-dependent methyltransferase